MKKLLFILALIIVMIGCKKTSHDPSITINLENDEVFITSDARSGRGKPPKNDPPPPPVYTVPSGKATFYIDIDGHQSKSAQWGYIYFPAPTGVIDTFEVGRQVRANFAGYNVEVTFDEAVFNAANPYKRIRGVATSSDFRPGSGYAVTGALYMGPLNPGETEAPEVIVRTSAMGEHSFYVSEVFSHEFGHACTLSHVHNYNPDCTTDGKYRIGYTMGNSTSGCCATIPDGKWHEGDPCRYNGNLFTNGGYGRSDASVLAYLNK